MLFYFLISIVFISELIIFLAVILYLKKLDKKVIEFDSFLTDIKPAVKEMFETVKKISEEILRVSPIIVEKIKSSVVDIVMGQLKSLAGALTFWLVKKEVEKHV